jgi:predicted double-glycine peptidase
MVTNYLGSSFSYSELVKQLGTKWFGTPFRQIRVLEDLGLKVSIEHLGLEEVTDYLQTGLPIIACVHTADLSYWKHAVDHVVVVIGIDEDNIILHDPSLDHGSTSIPRVEFELAQLGFDQLCAVLQL